MSKQFNYFALDKDFDFIHKTFINCIGEMFYFPDRGTSDEMTPQRISKVEDFNEFSYSDFYESSNIVVKYLVPASLLDSVVFIEVDSNVKRIDFRSCPVIEFVPGKVISEGVIKNGRIVLFYYDNLFVTKAMQQITKKLKTKAQRLSNGSKYYALENARKFANTYQYWVGNPISNPFKSKYDFEQ
jgi:hypothetical protein